MMKNQKGAALIVVLSLLTVSLMVGLSSMQSSQIDERLAGNYKAAATAQMAAEEAVSVGWESVPDADQFLETSLSELENIRWDEFLDNSYFEDINIMDGACENANCYYRYVNLDGEYYIVAMGGVDDGGVSVSEPVIVKLEFEGGPIFDFDPEATLTCMGNSCSFVPGSGNSGPVIDGTDREAEGQTQGSNRPDPVLDGDGEEIHVPAVIMADMESSIFDEQDNDEQDNGEGIVGEEFYSLEDYNDFKENKIGVDEFDADEDDWDATKSEIQTEINSTIDNIDDYENIFYAGEGETVSPGSVQGVVVINGGTLSLGGSDKFTGLVIMKGGNIESSGTPAIIGAIIGENFGFTGNGNPTVLYSSEAIGNVNNDSGESAGGSGPKPDILTWN